MLSFSHLTSLIILAIGLLTPKIVAMDHPLTNSTDTIFEQSYEEFFEFIQQTNNLIRTLQQNIKTSLENSRQDLQTITPH